MPRPVGVTAKVAAGDGECCAYASIHNFGDDELRYRRDLSISFIPLRSSIYADARSASQGRCIRTTLPQSVSGQSHMG